MVSPGQREPSQRLLVVMPTWLGDGVMAMPTLRALRELYPQAHITALANQMIAPIIDGNPWIDRIRTVRSGKSKKQSARRKSLLRLSQKLRGGQFDTAVLLPNSFRWALVTRMAGIPRRVGYDRDGRRPLLTDALLPRREQGRYVPICTRDYYLGIARYLGAADPSPKMQLFTRPEQEAATDALLKEAGYDPDTGRPLVILNPGANYGDAKMWFPDRFAAVGDRLAREAGAVVAVSGSPKERGILDRVIAAAEEPMLDFSRLGLSLAQLKTAVKRAAVMVTNDTGPRHIALAFGRPVVAIYGPTDPAWTDLRTPLERKVRVDVFCGPCQKKICPLDHRCMTLVDVDMVANESLDLLRLHGHLPAAGGPKAADAAASSVEDGS